MFNNYENLIRNKLSEIKLKGFFREYPVISQLSETSPYGINHKTQEKVIIFGNNNYLGMNQHPDVIKAKINAIKKFGVGSGGTRNILGTSYSLNKLEEIVSKWQNKEATLVHISALDANIGTLAALGKNMQNTIFLSDEKNHASMIDGIKLSGASKFIFRHNDLKELEKKLIEIRSASDSRSIVIAVESLYSMDGDFAPLKELVDLKKKYNAFLFVDEVHANGIYGKGGAGYVEALGLSKEVDVISGTFAKAVGVTGGFVSGSKGIIEFFRHESRNFIFTTAPSADNAEAIMKSVKILSSKEGDELRKRLFKNVDYLRKKLRESFIKFENNKSHITPIIYGNEERTKNIAQELVEKHNMAVTPIYYPTVPAGYAMIRINVTPYHNKKMIDKLCTTLSILQKKHKSSGNKKVAENDNSCDKNSDIKSNE